MNIVWTLVLSFTMLAPAPGVERIDTLGKSTFLTEEACTTNRDLALANVTAMEGQGFTDFQIIQDCKSETK